MVPVQEEMGKVKGENEGLLTLLEEAWNLLFPLGRLSPAILPGTPAPQGEGETQSYRRMGAPLAVGSMWSLVRVKER